MLPRHSLGSSTARECRAPHPHPWLLRCAQLSPRAACARDKCIISCSGWKLGSETGHVSPLREPGHVSCPPSVPATGLVLARGVGHGGIGVCLVFPTRLQEVGLLPGALSAGQSLGAVPELGHCWSRGHEDSLPPEVPTCVKGCQGRASLACHCSQGCHPSHLDSKGPPGVWCLLSRGCSKKGMSWLDVILGEPGWDVMAPAGMGAAELGSSPCVRHTNVFLTSPGTA